MKKHIFKISFLFVAVILSLITASGQVLPPVQDTASVYPTNPSAKDSVFVSYSYISSDGCPDFILVLDSIVGDRIYVGKKSIDNSNSICTAMVSGFTIKLNLGLLFENTQIYFKGNLIKTIHFDCIMDKIGIIVTGIEGYTGQIFIQELSPISSYRPLYRIKEDIINDSTISSGLKVDDKVRFGGYLLKNDSNTNVLCRIIGVATCFELEPTECIMDKVGIVFAVKDSTTLLKDSLTDDIYAIYNLKLEIGTRLKFNGKKIECFTTPCYNLVNCYEIIQTPPAPCVMDKVGMVVAGIDGCAGQIFIQEFSPISSYPLLYSIKEDIISDSTISGGLKVGDKVRFGGYLLKNDSNTNILCRIIGVATCFELEPTECIMDKVGIVFAVNESSTLLKDSLTDDIYVINNLKLAIGTLVKFNGVKIQCFTTPCYNIVNCYEIIQAPPAHCVMDKVGMVVAGVDGCAGKLFIEDTSYPGMSMIRQLYDIERNVSSTGIIQDELKVGDKVQFGGYLTNNDSSLINLCHTVGVATCYKIIETAPCVMDKTGIVVSGIDGCAGKLFIEDTSYPGMSMIRQLYDIERNVSSTGIIQDELKVGDIVQFGGYLTNNDSSLINLCHTVGVATCYKIIETAPCVMDKTGIVVSGIDGCTGQLFIQEYSPISSVRQLYSIKDISILNNSSTTSLGLKVGDKVKFGGYLTQKDSSMSILCYTVGVATCYEVINTESTYLLAGSVRAGSELMKTGYAVLFKKNYCKAIASSVISNGTFEFPNLAKAEYTVYAIPGLTYYKNYLPTFYVNKLKFKNADYIILNDSSKNVVVNLREFVLSTGHGRISGNIYFETFSLKDSVLAENGSNIYSINTIATNTSVILYNRTNEPVAWTMTDLAGYYIFENIALDTYKVVAETAAALGEFVVVLTDNNSAINADLLLKSQQTDTGLNNVVNGAINIYPNPMDDNLNIVLSDDTTVGIYNVLGKLVFNEKMKSGVNVLDLKFISKGIYIVKIGESTYRIVKK